MAPACEASGVISTLWHRALAPQGPPPSLLVLVTAALALAVVAYRPIWKVIRNVVTIVHESGHAVTAVLVGRRLQSIRLRSDTSGLTVTKGRPRGFGMVMTLVIGYVTPSLLGLGGAALLAHGHAPVALWALLLIFVGVLVLIRNFYGLVAVVLAGAAVFAVSWFAPEKAQQAFAFFAVWVLLVGGVRPLFELAGQRRRERTPGSDVDQLAAITPLPGGLWLFLFTLFSLGALVLGALVIELPGAVTHLTT